MTRALNVLTIIICLASLALGNPLLFLLSDTLPDYRESIAVITRIYQQARYSTASIPATCVEEASRAWALLAKADLMSAASKS